MLMCEFLTAVHHKLPVKAVVYNNSAFGLITLEAESVGLAALQAGYMHFPIRTIPRWRVPAAARVSRRRNPANCATRSTRRSRPKARPSSIASWRADEMPNFPHLELDKIGNYAIAKIKEAVLAVTG